MGSGPVTKQNKSQAAQDRKLQKMQGDINELKVQVKVLRSEIEGLKRTKNAAETQS